MRRGLTGCPRTREIAAPSLKKEMAEEVEEEEENAEVAEEAKGKGGGPLGVILPIQIEGDYTPAFIYRNRDRFEDDDEA